ncbi:MAG: TRAP transporter small permease [Alphaproteobacteria bacterium]
MTDPIGRALHATSRAFALGGGLVLVAMALLTTASVLGRATFLGPVNGDFELIEIGLSVAVLAVLPWTQMTRGNVVVDVFLALAPARVRFAFDAIGALLYALIAALIGWRLSLGGIDLFNYNEQTVILGIPRWWTFPLAIACWALLVLVCLHGLWTSLVALRCGEETA